jgi:hypothetical protein
MGFFPDRREVLLALASAAGYATVLAPPACYSLPRGHRVVELDESECFLQKKLLASAEFNIRKTVRELGLDPPYTSYVFHFVYTCLYTAGERWPDRSADLSWLSTVIGLAVDFALREFSDLPVWCDLNPVQNEAYATDARECIEAAELAIPHPSFRADDAPTPPKWPNGAPIWVSIENRPPLRPVWGERPLPATDMVDVALQPPPEVFSSQFQESLEEVRAYQHKASTQEIETALFWNDSTGTATPVGHWNAIASSMLGETSSHPRWIEVLHQLNRSLYVACLCCWREKYKYWYPRPIQFMKAVKTIIKTPNFPSYPSGHSVLSAAAMTTLGNLMPEYREELLRLAAEASNSRVIGGIHFRFDCERGFDFGARLAAGLGANMK